MKAYVMKKILLVLLTVSVAAVYAANNPNPLKIYKGITPELKAKIDLKALKGVECIIQQLQKTALEEYKQKLQDDLTTIQAQIKILENN